MAHARQAASVAAAAGDVPVGAVLIGPDGVGISIGHNTREAESDPCGHAEVNVLRAAARVRGHWRLDGCQVVVTLEPCAMCAGAMVLARISRCVYGASDPKGGFLGSLGNLAADPRLNHRFEVVAGVDAEENAAQLRDFFRSLRDKRRTPPGPT